MVIKGAPAHIEHTVQAIACLLGLREISGQSRQLDALTAGCSQELRGASRERATPLPTG
jgi:hypothetical protein